MNSSAVSPLDMTIKCQGPLKLYYQLPEDISDSTNTTATNCDNVKRYSRSKLYDLRNESHSRRRPEYDLRADLQSLGVWKFNTSGNVHQNGSGSSSEGTTSSGNANAAQLSSTNLSVRTQRSPSRRETATISSQQNLSHHNLHKTFVDHRSISSAHLMPAFAKRRIPASSALTSNSNLMGPQNLSSSGNSSYGPNSPVETRSQTPTEGKDGICYSNIYGGNSGHMRQRNKDQLYDYRQRGSSGGAMTGDDHNLFLSPQRKLLNQERERDREQDLQSNSRRVLSPVALSSSRHSHNNSGIAQERRIGSGRLLPRDVNWDYRGSQDRDKGQSLISAPISDKEALPTNHLGQTRNGGRYSDRSHERTSSGNGYSERRHLERRGGGGDDIIRDKYDYVGNTQLPNSHGGVTRRDVYGTDSSSQHQHSISHNRNGRNQKYHDRNEEPEWFSGGPTSQHDTIELRGFEEMDEYNGSSSGTKRTALPNSLRKISENSSSRDSSALNLPKSKSKDQLQRSLDQEKETNRSLNKSPTTLTTANSIPSFEITNSLPAEERGKESDDSNNVAKSSVRSSIAIDPALPDFMLDNEEITKNLNNSRDPEFNFDAFLNPNLDPLKHSLMRGDKSNNENEVIGSSRFSRWFANKIGGNEIQPSSGNDNAIDVATNLSATDTKNESNTLMEFLNKLPSLPDSVTTPKVTTITSVEELEARMGVMNTTNEVLPETNNLDMRNKKDQARAIDMILPIANEQVNSEQPQAGEIEAFKKLLEQLGSGNKQIQQQHSQVQQPPSSHLKSNVLISPKNRPDPMPPLNIMTPGAALSGPNLPQQVVIKNDELKKIMHPQPFHQQHQNNEDINILSQAQPIPLSVLFANHPQKRLEQNLIHGIQRGEVSIHFLEQQLNNPNTSPHVKEVISAVLRDTSTIATLNTNIPPPQQSSGPIRHHQQHSPICNSTVNLILHQGPINATIEPLQQQQMLQQVPNSNTMISGQTDRISLLPHQASNHQAITSQREIQFHTHTIMQNAILKKKIDEQQDSFRRRQEKHPQSNNMLLGLNEVDTQQKNMQQMHLSNSMQQQQSTGTQQQQAHAPHPIQTQHQPSRHINSPTPLAFTPTSVLRKMTAEKDNSNSNASTQHHTNGANSVIQQQNKSMAQSNFMNPTNNQHQMQQTISSHPRMILGGNHTQQQQQQQQMSSNNPLPPQSLNQTSQQQPVQQLRNSMAPMKWPLHLVNQNVTAIKPMGRPILKAPLPPQTGNQQQQQMPQISQMMFNKLDFQQIQQQLLKNNPNPQNVLNQSAAPFSQHAMLSQQAPNHTNIMPHVQHQQQLYQQQRVLALQRHQQQQQLHLQQQLHQQQPIDTSNRNICMPAPLANDSNGVTNNAAAAAAAAAASIINYQRDGGLSPTSNQLAQWFSPELLAQASAGKLPLLNVNQALSLEEFERNIQHSSTPVQN